ncbi:MAG: SDR family oxidoreductase [Deltaproteobacteria bacterium]|nr:SDR family oxidoreductase [Deltaproteobacteria bacterium]
MNTAFQNKHVVVTGASSGIGFDAVSRFLAEGAKVTACYNSAPRELTTLKDSYPERLNVVKVDVRNESEVALLFTEANTVFGRVDITVANAGIAFHEGVAVHEMSIEQWQKTLSVNLTGVFLCAKHFFANLKKYPGDDASLVFVGSTAGEIGQALFCDYSTSKAGLRGLLMTLKNEIIHLAVRGRVNLVNPGWTITPMTEGELSDKAMVSRIMQTIPLRKVATPSDITHAILYLSSDKLAGHVSGQTITVAGGMEGRVLFSSDEVEEYMQ